METWMLEAATTTATVAEAEGLAVLVAVTV
jgi:hypothetical protein